MIRTHVVQLLQLSEFFCALLRFFAFGAAQKSPKIRDIFLIFSDQNTYYTAFTAARYVLRITSTFRLWRSTKVAKIYCDQNSCCAAATPVRIYLCTILNFRFLCDFLIRQNVKMAVTRPKMTLISFFQHLMTKNT